MAVCQNCSNKEDLKSHLGATLFFAAHEHSTMGHCVVAMNKLAQLRPRFLTEEKLTTWVKKGPKCVLCLLSASFVTKFDRNKNKCKLPPFRSVLA